MTTREPEYDDQGRALIAASDAAERAPRGSHGLLMSVATDPANMGRFEAEPVTDFAKEALNAASAKWRTENGDVMDVNAVVWRVKLPDDD